MAWLYGPAAAGFHKVSVSDRWCGFEHVLCHGTGRLGRLTGICQSDLRGQALVVKTLVRPLSDILAVVLLNEEA